MTSARGSAGRRMRHAPLVLALLVAGCSSAGSGPKATSAGYASAGALAAKVGCSGYSSSWTEMYVKEGGECTLSGKTITVKVFNTDKARDDYLKVAKYFDVFYATGPRWLIHGDDQATVAAAAKTAGGTLSQ